MYNEIYQILIDAIFNGAQLTAVQTVGIDILATALSFIVFLAPFIIVYWFFTLCARVVRR